MGSSSVVASAPGAGAGLVAHSLATGTVAAGTVSVVTGYDTSEDVVVEVSFDVDDVLSKTFSVTQNTSTGVGTTLTHSVQSLETGFTITATGVPVANTLYVFAWT